MFSVFNSFLTEKFLYDPGCIGILNKYISQVLIHDKL